MKLDLHLPKLALMVDQVGEHSLTIDNVDLRPRLLLRLDFFTLAVQVAFRQQELIDLRLRGQFEPDVVLFGLNDAIPGRVSQLADLSPDLAQNA